jgi:hypothetical protein
LEVKEATGARMSGLSTSSGFGWQEGLLYGSTCSSMVVETGLRYYSHTCNEEVETHGREFGYSDVYLSGEEEGSRILWRMRI